MSGVDGTPTVGIQQAIGTDVPMQVYKDQSAKLLLAQQTLAERLVRIEDGTLL